MVIKHGLNRPAMGLVVPSFIYFVLFSILTFPLIRFFSTDFFADGGDGLGNVWNLWWINKAVTDLHQSPWWTGDLHYPSGISLLGHTLNPFNGFLSIPLLRVMSLVQAHNVVILFSFVFGGITAFWLAREELQSPIACLLAGAIFTFSSFHFMHAEGHMQMVALEWIPLFLLFWRRFWKRPSHRLAVGAGLTLFVVILCDYYYCLYCVLLGVLVVIEHSVRTRRLLLFASPEYRWPLLSFVGVSLATAGVLVFLLLRLNQIDPLCCGHPAEEYSLDLLAPFVPGGHWYFNSLSQSYWSKITGNINESSVYLGLSTIALCIYASVRRKVSAFWYLSLGVFAVLALGPVLHVWGRVVSRLPLPYAWLAELIPSLKLSGCPVRMMVVVSLCAAIIAAHGFEELWLGPRWKRLIALSLVAVLAVEYWPRALPHTRPQIPAYVEELRQLPRAGVVDLSSSENFALYYQTLHHQPLMFGIVSRVPLSVRQQDQMIQRAISSRDHQALCREFGIGYVVVRGRVLQLGQDCRPRAAPGGSP